MVGRLDEQFSSLLNQLQYYVILFWPLLKRFNLTKHISF